MTDKDRHSTCANSKVSNPSSQSWYTPLVEVNQAKLAWSFRQRLIPDQILKLEILFQVIYDRCCCIYVLKKENSFNPNLSTKVDVLKQSQLIFHLLWCYDFCLIYEILSILCVAVCATSCGENRHYRQGRSTSHLVAAGSVSCLLRASLGHWEWCKAEWDQKFGWFNKRNSWNHGMYPFIVIGYFILKPSTHYRINLSPFTKDFRVWGAPIETNKIYLRVTLGWLPKEWWAYRKIISHQLDLTKLMLSQFQLHLNWNMSKSYPAFLSTWNKILAGFFAFWCVKIGRMEFYNHALTMLTFLIERAFFSPE